VDNEFFWKYTALVSQILCLCCCRAWLMMAWLTRRRLAAQTTSGEREQQQRRNQQQAGAASTVASAATPSGDSVTPRQCSVPSAPHSINVAGCTHSKAVQQAAPPKQMCLLGLLNVTVLPAVALVGTNLARASHQLFCS
jgi:hypothetical protein